MPGRRRTSVVEKEERKRIDLKIEVEDFGPISGGEITLKPLTVFIGPNNSGKSYAAMLIHSIFESYPIYTSMGEVAEWVKRFEKQFDDSDSEEGEELDITRRSIEAVTKVFLEIVYQERLSDEVIRSFACPLDELIRIGKSSFEVKISYDPCSIHLTYQEGELKIKCPRLDIQPDTKITVKGGGKLDYRAVFLDLIADISPKVVGDVAMQCYYLPAARSGILQGHKALVANIVRKLPYVGIERLEIPKFSGVVSDFISSIIDLPREEGPFYQLVRHFEKELIRGEIVVPIPDQYLYPEIKYSFQDTEIPLHRSSSTVSELAPLFLYLKYKVKPNSILMIEEPEAHLHPANQRILARLLVRLVREGVNIVITTHSEYLLEQLSNFIMLSKVEPKKREEKYKYTEEDFLEPDEIAAYVFDYDAEAAGHRIGEVEITEEDGISDEEFAKVYEALYDETIKLRRDLSDET